MNSASSDPSLETTSNTDDAAAPRLNLSMAISLTGLLIFAIGAKPGLFGWDRSPVIGFVQIAVFIFGLAIICIGGYIGILTLWWNRERTIISDIGTRVVATGYVIAVFAGMADVFGMGSQPYPQVPYFGPLQATGVLIGQIVIAIGFLLFIPYRARDK
jgi:hypothetical protein